jgi:hypothetical protein
LGADILIVFIIFSIKSVEIMKIMVVFIVYMFVHGFHVKEKCFLSFFRSIFQENFEIQDGRQRSHDQPIEKKFQTICFSSQLYQLVMIWNGSEKSIITLLNV